MKNALETETVPTLDKETTVEPTTSVAAPSTVLPERARRVTMRALLIGFIGAGVMAFLNSWMATKFNVHMIGGIQMPFAPLAVLMVFALANRFIKTFTPTELLTMYSMMLVGALISTPGCDNTILAVGPALFYFSSPENRWQSIFWEHVPSWYAPGWDGKMYQKEVIDPFYLGGIPNVKDIPWQAWTPTLVGWGIFLLLTYALLFFTALLFRKQWTKHEALAYPLVEVPVQMAGAEGANSPALWTNRLMWVGFALALFFHMFKGMNALYPDFPIMPVNQHGSVPFTFTEQPWNAVPTLRATLYLGGIGLAYLLTREVSFSFWFFYLAAMFSFGFAQLLGFPVAGMERAGIVKHPAYLIYATTGGWIVMALILIYGAREYLGRLVRATFSRKSNVPSDTDDEPFAPRTMVLGWLFSVAALLGWSWFAGINLFAAVVFFGMFFITSLVLSRIVIEGGFMFPQAPYSTLETMTTGFGLRLGASDLTKLGFAQPAILLDIRTSVLPMFLHTMKIAETLRLERTQLRRLLIGVVAALLLTMVVTAVSTLQVIYSQGGLQGYTWFSKGAGEMTFQQLSTSISNPPQLNPMNWSWMALGGLIVWMVVLARSRFLWFPLHPLGFLMCSGYPITQLWFSFFLGWLIKNLVMKYGGNDTYVALRPFMIGMILGNAMAMLFWTFLTFKINGTPVSYWPA